jgi:hypothetical protein
MDLRDVEAGRPVEQIREQSELQAWRNDGAQVAAAVISTGGYRDSIGTYSPVVGILDTESSITPSLIEESVLSRLLTVNVVDTYLRSRVTFDANGGILVGPRVITVVEPETHLPYLPISPIRDGYSFRYWATSPTDGVQFTYDTPLNGDLTVYALWDALPSPPTVTPQTPPTLIVNNPPASGGGSFVAVEPGAETGATMPSDLETPRDLSSAPDTTPPLAGSDLPIGWSLFDLMATIFALLLLVVFSIRFFFDRSRGEEYEEEPVDGQLWAAMTPEQRVHYQAQRESDYQLWLTEQQKEANRQTAFWINIPVLLIVAVFLIEALIVLLFTQDFDLGMSVVDEYSIIFALAVFAQLFTPVIAAIIRNNRHEKQRLLAAKLSTTKRGDQVTP